MSVPADRRELERELAATRARIAAYGPVTRVLLGLCIVVEVWRRQREMRKSELLARQEALMETAAGLMAEHLASIARQFRATECAEDGRWAETHDATSKSLRLWRRRSVMRRQHAAREA